MNNLQRRNFLKLAATSALIPATGCLHLPLKIKLLIKKPSLISGVTDLTILRLNMQTSLPGLQKQAASCRIIIR